MWCDKCRKDKEPCGECMEKNEAMAREGRLACVEYWRDKTYEEQGELFTGNEQGVRNV